MLGTCSPTYYVLYMKVSICLADNISGLFLFPYYVQRLCFLILCYGAVTLSIHLLGLGLGLP